MKFFDKYVLWSLSIGFAVFWWWVLSVYGTDLEMGWLVAFPAVCVLSISLIVFNLVVQRYCDKSILMGRGNWGHIIGIFIFAGTIIFLQFPLGMMLFNYTVFSPEQLLLIIVIITISLFLTISVVVRYIPKFSSMIIIFLIFISLVLGVFLVHQGKIFSEDREYVYSKYDKKTLTESDCASVADQGMQDQCYRRLSELTGNYSCGDISRRSFQCFFDKAVQERSLSVCDDPAFEKISEARFAGSGGFSGVSFDNRREACRFEIGAQIFYAYAEEMDKQQAAEKMCTQFYGSGSKFAPCVTHFTPTYN